MAVNPVSHQSPIPRGGTQKLACVIDNVWEWVASSIGASPIQPVVDLGLGLGFANFLFAYAETSMEAHFNNLRQDPPQFLINAHKEALDLAGCNQYAPPGGLPAFAEALSRFYSPLYGRHIEPTKDISVHSGGTEAILSVITAFVEPGDEIILMQPGFDLYELHSRFVGATVKHVRLHPPSHTGSSNADDWTLDMNDLDDSMSSKSKLLILNTPHNPLGKVFTVEELLSIGRLCVKYGVIILSDEVYEHLYYSANFPRIATLDENIARYTITIGSIGKAFNATGWRVGYAIGNQALIQHVQWAHIILSFTTTGPAQMAGASGLNMAEGKSFWEKNRIDMKRKIDDLCQIFVELDLPYVMPSGAHYVVFNASKVRMPNDYPFPENIISKPRDWRLCWFLINQLGVATIPVSASFGGATTDFAQEYLRLVVCKSDAELQVAKERLAGLKQFLN